MSHISEIDFFLILFCFLVPPCFHVVHFRYGTKYLYIFLKSATSAQRKYIHKSYPKDSWKELLQVNKQKKNKYQKNSKFQKDTL